MRSSPPTERDIALVNVTLGGVALLMGAFGLWMLFDASNYPSRVPGQLLPGAHTIGFFAAYLCLLAPGLKMVIDPCSLVDTEVSECE